MEQGYEGINNAEQMKAIRHLPINVVLDRLFLQGGFKKFTSAYGDQDLYHFQALCTNWDSVEDYQWIEAISMGLLVQTLPHPAHAVLLFQKENPTVPESVNAWRCARRCGLEILDLQLMVRVMQILWRPDSAVFRGKVQLSQFHEKRSTEGWRRFSQWLMFLCAWWGQPECPQFEGCDMETATVALAKEEEAIAFRSGACEEDDAVLNTVRDFFNQRGSHSARKFFETDGLDQEFAEVIKNFAALVTRYPTLKWRLTRILHEATAGIPVEWIEALRYRYGSKQYTQQYFSRRVPAGGDTLLENFQV